MKGQLKFDTRERKRKRETERERLGDTYRRYGANEPNPASCPYVPIKVKKAKNANPKHCM